MRRTRTKTDTDLGELARRRGHEQWASIFNGAVQAGDDLLSLGPKLWEMVVASPTKFGLAAAAALGILGPSGKQAEDRFRDRLPIPLCDLPAEGSEFIHNTPQKHLHRNPARRPLAQSWFWLMLISFVPLMLY